MIEDLHHSRGYKEDLFDLVAIPKDCLRLFEGTTIHTNDELIDEAAFAILEKVAEAQFELSEVFG
jgi:hypothetical protein